MSYYHQLYFHPILKQNYPRSILIDNHSAKTIFKVQQFRQALYQSITTKISYKIILKMKQYFWTKVVYLFRSSRYHWEMGYLCWKVTYQIINPSNNRWIFFFVVRILFIVVITITICLHNLLLYFEIFNCISHLLQLI